MCVLQEGGFPRNTQDLTANRQIRYPETYSQTWLMVVPRFDAGKGNRGQSPHYGKDITTGDSHHGMP